MCTETKQLYNLLQHSEALYGRGHHRWHGERRGKWDRPVVGRAASTASSSRPKPPKPAANWQGGHHLQQQISATSQFDGQLTCPMAGNRPPKKPDRHSSFVAILFWPFPAVTATPKLKFEPNEQTENNEGPEFDLINFLINNNNLYSNYSPPGRSQTRAL